MKITTGNLTRIGIKKGRAEVYAPLISDLSDKYGITTPKLMAHFLSQMCVESGYFVYTREIWGPTVAQMKYDTHPGLGNKKPGDGKKYMGRGLMQITGLYNYAQETKESGVDYVNSPELLERPKDAIESAFRYWKRKKINNVKNINSLVVNPETLYLFSVESVTRLVNGGLNGIDRRNTVFLVALRELLTNPATALES